MNYTAKKKRSLEPAPQPVLEYGRVLAGTGDRFVVDTPRGKLTAEKAVGCLVQPRPGDLILASVDGPEQGFILSVLRRGPLGTGETDLVFDGQVNIQVRGGSLAVSAEQELSLASGEDLTLVSDRVSVNAREGRARFKEAFFTAGFLNSRIERIKAAAESVDQVFHRLTQRLFESFRYVKDHEEIQAGSQRTLVEDVLTVHSKNAVFMSEEIHKIDAGQVHLG
ncbi:MAG: DUF3540 domain-containing protein [Pseudomonadota bacterium]